ncbi:MAG: M23 family metallopeptidase [Pseudomonadota bacterium]
MNETALQIGASIARALFAALISASVSVQTASADDSIRPDSLAFPVDCELGTTCIIQNYVDRDPGPGVADFTCGPLTYNGHKGTDFRLLDDAAMERGVNVLAALEGTVIGARDGMRDVRWTQEVDLEGRDCGNGMVVERADGVSVQYCHLRRGSVSVRKGDRVTVGQVLGQIGLSGRSQFPHLHITVRNPSGAVLDPFDARLQDATCKFGDRRDLWATLDKDDYQPGGLLTAGFSDHVPKYGPVLAGTADQSGNLDVTAEALVIWANFFGVRKGDIIDLLLTDPRGRIVAQSSHQMTRNRAQQFRATGRKRRGEAWEKGVYKAVVVLRREYDIVSQTEHELSLQ